MNQIFIRFHKKCIISCGRATVAQNTCAQAIPFKDERLQSDVELEQHNIAILDDIFLAFGSGWWGGPMFCS